MAKAKKEQKVGEFEIYRQGLTYMSVCTDMEPAEAEAYAEAVSPAGTKMGWKISKDKTFATGEPNPCPCDQKPKTHVHILFEC